MFEHHSLYDEGPSSEIVFSRCFKRQYIFGASVHHAEWSKSHQRSNISSHIRMEYLDDIWV